MSITVNTNVQALKIQTNLSSATDKMNTAMERMSSGYKINQAADDAAGSAISTRLAAELSSSQIATKNAQIGSNMLTTAEGTLNTIQSNLHMNDHGTPVTKSTYSRWECNQGVPQADQFLTLCQIFGVRDILGTFAMTPRFVDPLSKE